MTAAVEARGITVRRGNATLLDDVSVEANSGEVVAIVGPNGAGKSTLLAVLAGDERPVAGEARVAGDPVLSLTPIERARRRAVLTQDASIAFGFRVAEVVAMGRVAWHGTSAAADDDGAVARAIAATEVTDLADRRVTSLSGGEFARVVLARTLAQAAPVLLLDEPTASLDLRHTAGILELARRHAAGGGAVVIVLHDLTAAARWADRLVLMHRGRVRATGQPTQVLQTELLSEVYDHPVDVIVDPHSGEPIVLPARAHDVNLSR